MEEERRLVFVHDPRLVRKMVFNTKPIIDIKIRFYKSPSGEEIMTVLESHLEEGFNLFKDLAAKSIQNESED